MELSFRSQESKESGKISPESEANVAPFFKLLSQIGDRNPGLLENPHRIWNLDETRVDYIFRKKEKVFTSSTSHHGAVIWVYTYLVHIVQLYTCKLPTCLHCLIAVHVE